MNWGRFNEDPDSTQNWIVVGPQVKIYVTAAFFTISAPAIAAFAIAKAEGISLAMK